MQSRPKLPRMQSACSMTQPYTTTPAGGGSVCTPLAAVDNRCLKLICPYAALCLPCRLRVTDCRPHVLPASHWPHQTPVQKSFWLLVPCIRQYQGYPVSHPPELNGSFATTGTSGSRSANARMVVVLPGGKEHMRSSQPATTLQAERFRQRFKRLHPRRHATQPRCRQMFKAAARATPPRPCHLSAMCCKCVQCSPPVRQVCAVQPPTI